MTDRSALKLNEIASRIGEHLKRFAADPEIAIFKWTDAHGREHENLHYCYPSAYRAGSRIKIKYVSYQYERSLKREEAVAYLAWLDAGNVGTFHEMRESRLNAQTV